MLWKSTPAFKAVPRYFQPCLLTRAFEMQTLFIHSQSTSSVKETHNSAQTVEIQLFVCANSPWIKVKYLPSSFQDAELRNIKVPFQTEEWLGLRICRPAVITEPQVMFV